MMKSLAILSLSGLLSVAALAQSTLIPLNTPGYHFLDRQDIKSSAINPSFHTSLKPFARKSAVLFLEAQEEATDMQLSAIDRQNQYYLYKDSKEWSGKGQIDSKKPILKYFYTHPSDLYSLNTDLFFVRFNPVAHLQYHKEQLSTGNDNPITVWPLDNNTRGIEVSGMIDKKVGFYTFMADNQSFYQRYVQSRIARDQAVPGEGFYKDFNKPDKTGGVDYFTARGYITFPATRHIGVQFGHDKNFIGNGYRSLLLSDYAANYLFLKINTEIWKINYQNLYTELHAQFNRGADTLLPKKYAVFHHLSYNVNRWLNIGLFESVIFSRQNQFELQYLNPIIFYRFVEQKLGSPDNAMVGMDFKVNALKHFSLYGQLLLDEFLFKELKAQSGWWANKFGIQTGLKYIDVAGISNLDAIGEVNIVRPYTYTHRGISNANHTHYNQPLAHPLGANFREFVGIIRYQPVHPVLIQAKLLQAVYGADSTDSNWGADVFQSYDNIMQIYGNTIGQGVRTQLMIAELILTYQWRHNLFFDLIFRHRQEDSALDIRDNQGNYVGAAIRWNIARKHLDF